jgi:hypothetical protein
MFSRLYPNTLLFKYCFRHCSLAHKFVPNCLLQVYVADAATKTQLLRLLVTAVLASSSEAVRKFLPLFEVQAVSLFHWLMEDARSLQAPTLYDKMAAGDATTWTGVYAPVIVPVLQAVSQLVVLPCPGFYTLGDCLAFLAPKKIVTAVAAAASTTATTTTTVGVPTMAEIFAAGSPELALTLCTALARSLDVIVCGVRAAIYSYCVPV